MDIREYETVARRYARLHETEEHLREASLGTIGMPAAHEAVQTALRYVARQAGKVRVRLDELREERRKEEARAVDEEGTRSVAVR